MEAGHGKGPCDGIGGAIMNRADTLVKSDRVIRSAQEFVTELQQHESKVQLLYCTSKVCLFVCGISLTSGQLIKSNP